MLGVRKDKLYKLQFEPTCALVSSSKSGRDLGELWHRRMAHLHHGALKVLREAVTGLPKFSYDQHDVCKGCALGKYAKTTFPSSDSRSIQMFVDPCQQCLLEGSATMSPLLTIIPGRPGSIS